MIIGEVKKDGTIKFLSGADGENFKIERINTGLYKIIHNVGTANCFVNVTAIGSPATFGIIKDSEIDCIIASNDLNGVEQDADFSFSIMWEGDKDMYVLGERGDFTAFVDYKGQLLRFDFPHHLKEFLEKIY